MPAVCFLVVCAYYAKRICRILCVSYQEYYIMAQITL